MPSLTMGDTSYQFDEAAIERVVQGGKIGNYALGYEAGGGFQPKYVGRSDTDVKTELKVNLPATRTRQRFKFSYAATKKEAFDKECMNYHDFKVDLENDIHPRRPDATNYPCPVLGCTDLK